MKKEQILLEQAYEKTKTLKLGKDETSIYADYLSSDRKILKNRFYGIYDKEGNKLDGKTVELEPGQVIFKNNFRSDWDEFYQVERTENGFVGVQFQPSSEVKANIYGQKKKSVEADKEQAMAHFFPKGLKTENVDKIKKPLKFTP